jgi:lipid-A-disaccharide synthase
VRKIGAACDLVLCLFPFETDFYTRHQVAAQFVGHPLADQIPIGVDRAGARRALGIDPGATLIALLPGSRMGEVGYLAGPFATAAARLSAQRPRWQFIAPMASAAARERFVREVSQVPAVPEIRLVDGEAHAVLAACDAALVASGTATLETLLSGRPMVVAYRANPVTAFVIQSLGLVKVRYFSQPNLLAGRRLVPEFLQGEVDGGRLADALLHELEDPEHVRELLQEFATVHRALRCGGAGRAADAILALCAGARSAGSL